MKSQKATLNVRRTFAYLFLIFLTIISLLPFYILIVNSTRLHAQISRGFTMIPGKYFIRNLINLISNDNIPILMAMFNSFIVSLFNAVLSTYFSAMTAYGIHMYRFKGRNAAFKFIMAIMMVPGQVTALGFVSLISKMNLTNSLIPLIVPAIAAPVTFFYMMQYLQATLPKSIVEAARVDGCNEFHTFNIIVIPMIKPAIAVQAIFSFVGSWNNYFMPSLLIDEKYKKTVPILIAQLRSADYSKFDLAQVYMLICMAIVPLLIIYLFLSRYIIAGVTSGGVKE